ncbi:hypothetical protein FQR65_LT16159 [Abscondita terminalis]|nr:hypothetical protein FQR65_LT16159 [Abscondita terminalis]
MKHTESYKKDVAMELDKYETLKKSLTKALKTKKEMTFKEMLKSVTNDLNDQKISFKGVHTMAFSLGTNGYGSKKMNYPKDAFELKAEKFKPEHLGQINFYLEALDRDVKKQNENPSIGILLCKGKDSEVVEYALSRSLSPALVSDYQTQLPDKKLLQQKLHELFENSSTEE